MISDISGLCADLHKYRPTDIQTDRQTDRQRDGGGALLKYAQADIHT